jgi:CheY-like chemotaxis protein
MVNLPFFFPTRVVLIDDEPQVLRLTALLFGAHPEVAEVVTFENAQAALDFLRAEAAQRPALDAFATAQVHDEFDYEAPHGGPIRREVRFDLRELDRALLQPHLRRLVSVVVCDYAMPGMDGLAFFDEFNDPSVRRVMLTALCDEHRAVQAFNRGLIHQFVHKADPAGPRGLEAMLLGQIRAFFRARSIPLAAALALGEAGAVLQHAALAEVLTTALAETGCTEYAVRLAPLGYQLHGTPPRARAAALLLADGNAFDRAARAVREIDGPETLARALQAREVMPFTRTGRPILDAAGDGIEPGDQTLAPRIAGYNEPLYWALANP